MNTGAELAGQGVVVTGAARGIGRAIALRLASEGARLVVSDLDEQGLQTVAEEAGGLAVPGDAATPEGVASLIERATQYLGEIDVDVANAGVSRGFGLDASEADWAINIEVNLMAHVRAARILVPTWLERGRGRFVVTASAAGLLMSLGAATYSSTKHAAVGFAEWLSATYRHRGIQVHAVCPQGVQTAMLEKSGAWADLMVTDAARTPDEVGDTLMEAIEQDRFLALPHPEVAGYHQARAADTDRWLSGMNRLQQRFETRQQ
ncbi:SDR family oxidoreductase [Nonomuraea lactucae]|uniref:SDR family oxidoreductase n=1 Tax=Nonomuraea lactucae TaxID=2249762 RepID=UPI000DE1AD3E|nr:SDR family oxidoreductase [Nonomuraea lactucae]